MATEMKQIELSDSNHYKKWSSADTVKWIISIDPSKFEKYREVLAISFEKSNFDGKSLVDLDREDLKEYGIINLDDRKVIYKAVIQLMATQKKRESKILGIIISAFLSLLKTNSNKYLISDSEVIGVAISSLFAVSEEEKGQKVDYIQLLSLRQELMRNGYCKWISDKSYKEIVTNLTMGYIKNNYQPQYQEFSLSKVFNNDVFGVITQFYGITFGSFCGQECVQLQCQKKRYRTTVTNISLSTVLKKLVQESDTNTVIIDDIRDEEKQEPVGIPFQTLEHTLLYLGHHQGVEPPPLAIPVRSIHMSQNCSDRWDADWIDAFDKKTIFEIILAANHLKIQPLCMFKIY